MRKDRDAADEAPGCRERMTGELFPPQGFQYRDEAIAVERERALVAQFEKLPLRPFEFHGYPGKRRVVSFGKATRCATP